jgi:DNA polymerase III sliding clamp (beta) subunit (PCNA family)
MTFVSLDQKNLQKVLAICNQISPKKNEIDLFTYTKIEITSEGLWCTALNQSISFKDIINTKNFELSSEQVIFLVKTDLIANSVALIEDEQVTFEVDLDKLTLLIQGSKTKHTVRIDTAHVSEFIAPQE